MQKLWGKFWFRVLASLIAAPPLIVVSILLAGSLVEVVLNGGTPFIPPAEAIPYLLIGGAVMTLPLWIAMELLNRRWRRPFPPGLAAGYVAAFGCLFIALLYAASRIDALREIANSGIYTPFLAMGGAYVVAVLLTTALASPIIRRWKKRTATPAELSGLF